MFHYTNHSDILCSTSRLRCFIFITIFTRKRELSRMRSIIPRKWGILRNSTLLGIASYHCGNYFFLDNWNLWKQLELARVETGLYLFVRTMSFQYLKKSSEISQHLLILSMCPELQNWNCWCEKLIKTPQRRRKKIFTVWIFMLIPLNFEQHQKSNWFGMYISRSWLKSALGCGQWRVKFLWGRRVGNSSRVN